MPDSEIIDINSLTELSVFATSFSSRLKGGETLGLIGELGAGKTTLTRFLASAFVSPDQVSSPTYVLEQEYRTGDGIILQHWDLYRLSAIPEDLDQEPDSNVIRIVEWIEKFPEYSKKADIIIKISNPFSAEQPEKRQLLIERNSNRRTT